MSAFGTDLYKENHATSLTTSSLRVSPPPPSQCGRVVIQCSTSDQPVPVVDTKLEERLLDILRGAEIVHRLCAHRARRHPPRLLGGARFCRRNSNLASKRGRLAVVHPNNFEHSILLQAILEFPENGIIPRQNIHNPCNRSGKSAALASANPEVASAIDRSSPAFSTLVSRSSRGSRSPLFGSMRQSILGDQCCNRSGEHGGRSIGANPVVIGYCDTLYITCVTITDLRPYPNVHHFAL